MAIGRSTGRSTPQVHICSGQEWQFNNSIVSYRHINWQIYPPELISSGQGWQLADQLADLPPQVHICSGQEWQFNISIVSYRQINWQIYPSELTSSSNVKLPFVATRCQ